MNMTAKIFVAGLFFLLVSCEQGDGPLAPYHDSNRPLSAILIQDSVLTAKITWVGGYVSVFGVNEGSTAILDTSLRWLLYAPGNALQYPVTMGQLPGNAQDMTSGFGGQAISAFSEDRTYTVWVMMEELWNQVSSQPNKILRVDSAATVPVRASGDTLFLDHRGFTVLTDTIDIFINTRNVNPGGRLGTISVAETDTDNHPIVSFSITQTTDTAVAAMGLVIGSTQYDVNSVVWEVLSDDDQGNFRTLNVIESPVIMGAEPARTRTFTVFPANGLTRNRQYYFWLATKDWDGVGRGRTANFYAWVTFETW